MTLFQTMNGPDRLDLPGSSPYDSGIVFGGSTPPAPFDMCKREYWAIKNGQDPYFTGQAIAEISTMAGVSATSCTDFVNYLKGKNGGPPSYAFNRYVYNYAWGADRPDLFGPTPNIPGWTTPVNYKITFTGTDDKEKPFQGVILRRWAQNMRNFEEYWLLDTAGVGPGYTVTFASQVSSSARPKELVSEFPDLLPEPNEAGALSTFIFWYDQNVWDTLDSDPDNWQSQICGS